MKAKTADELRARRPRGVTGMISKLRRRRRAAIAKFSAADAELAETLDNLDDAANYAGWILELFAPHLGEEVLEVGAGHGTFTEKLARKAKRVVDSDVSQRCVAVL